MTSRISLIGIEKTFKKKIISTVRAVFIFKAYETYVNFHICNIY